MGGEACFVYLNKYKIMMTEEVLILEALVTVKDKVNKIREFERRHILFKANGDFQNISVKTFWTLEGRKRILKDIKRKLRILLKDYNCSYQITLTYRDFSDYSKSDIRKFLNSFTRMFRYRNVDFKYFWVAEIQKRGMIHYHILFFFKLKDRKRVFDYMSKNRIDRLWNRGYTFITFSRQTIKKAYNYVTKYLLKTIKRENDLYLELVLYFREWAGRFRLYGMSQVRKFRKGVRKKLQEQYQKYYYDKLEALEFAGLDNLLRWGYDIWGVWQKRTGRVVKRYCSWLGRDVYKNMKRYVDDSLNSAVENLLFELDYCSEDDIIELIDF